MSKSESDDEAIKSLLFAVKWKNPGSASADGNYVDGGVRNIVGPFPRNLPERRKWENFRALLTNNCVIGRVTYIDSDGDEIPIESQCEFDECLRSAERANSTTLIVEKLGDAPGNTAASTEDPGRKTSTNVRQNQTAMASTKLCSRVQELEQTTPLSGRECNGTQAESPGDAAPKWFTDYMQTMKDEIVSEVSERVIKSMTEALIRRQEIHYDSATSSGIFAQGICSESECLLDSEPDERFARAETTHDKRRRRHRQADKQRKKPPHTRSSRGSHTANTDDNRRRGEKTARNKRATNEDENEDEAQHPRVSPHNSGRPVFISSSELRKLRLSRPNDDGLSDYCVFSDSDNVDSIVSDVSYDSVTLRHRNLSETTTREQWTRKADSEKDRAAQNVTVSTAAAAAAADYVHVTRDPEHDAGFQRFTVDPDDTRDSSSFELLSEPPSTPPFIHMNEDHFAPDIGNNDDNDDYEPNDYNINETTNEKRGNRSKIDGCTYAIDALGKIYQRNITDDDNESGEEEIVLEKRTGGTYSFVGETLPAPIRESVILVGGADMPVGRSFVADDDAAGVEEVADEARENGAAAFHESTQSFHSHTAQHAENERQDFADFPRISKERRADNERQDLADSRRTSKEGRAENEGQDSTNSRRTSRDRRAENERQDFTDSRRNSRQGQADNERQNFAGFAATGAATSSAAAASHVFVDRNASKGLGDTRQSSPRKKQRGPTAGKKSAEDAEPSERARSSRRTSQDSSGSGNRNANSRHDRDSRRFANWYAAQNSRMMNDLVFNAVDPMHILPETIVTGAVHVASSAYTTARRVYDKILTAQTLRKHADRSQSKFGRR